MTDVIGLGAGGHAKVVIEILALGGEANVIGLLDPDAELHGRKLLGIPVLGGDEELAAQHAAGVRHAFIGLGGTADTRPRRRLYELVREQGFELVDAVHPAAVVSPSSSSGPGVTLMAGAVVNAGAGLGQNVIVNTAAVVEHDCRVGSHVHVATGARLSGGVAVGEGAHVGAGATLNPGVRIGARAVVGSGAVVVRDVPEATVVAGVPAEPLRERVG